MKTSHFALLFALVSFASAAYDDDDDDDDDDVTDETEESQNGVDINVCYDKEVCEIVVYSDMMCQLPSAAFWCPKLCKKGCGAPAGQTRKREMEELDEYMQLRVRAARIVQNDCRADDNTCCNADKICNEIKKELSWGLCKYNPDYCCKTCTDFYGPKNQWKKNQLISLLERILEK